MADIWRNRLPHKPGHFVVEFFSKALFLFFFFLLSFCRCLSPRPGFLVCSPSLCPTSPFLPPLQRAGAWALALNSDPACNQSYPWALPSSQATDSSLLLPLPPSPPLPPFLSLSPVFFPLPLFPLAGYRAAVLAFDGVLLGDNRE